MERTESFVVQVAPNYENEKIKEMETFGWNLQGRQEMHEEGDAYGSPSENLLGGSTYVIKTTVKHYVKLHFVRSLSLPNLDRIKPLEAEYFGLPFPEFPRLAPGGILLILFWYPFWPLWYFLGYRPRRARAQAELTGTLRRREELLRQVAAIG